MSHHMDNLHMKGMKDRVLEWVLLGMGLDRVQLDMDKDRWDILDNLKHK